MPKKGGKKGKKKGKKRGKKKATVANADAVMKQLLKCYEKNCAITESQICPDIRKNLRLCAENGTVLSKFILEAVPVESKEDPPVLVEPLLAALRQERYTHIKDLHIWDYPMSYENVATLSLLLEKPFYPVRLLEMMDCLLEPYSLKRLSTTLRATETLTQLVLDYNEFGDEGCEYLCKGLEGNTILLSASLCYCGLNVASGKYLGQAVATTALRDLYLDGNDLECEGAMELIKLCADQAEYEAFQKAEEARKKAEEEAEKSEKEKERGYTPAGTSADEGSKSEGSTTGGKKKKKKGKKKKKKKAPPPPPRVGPWLHKLHLADNGIDALGSTGTPFAPLICMRLFKKLLMYSDCIEELDLDDNLIGDLAGREILEALEFRKNEKLPGVKLKTTHRMNADTFASICKLGTGLKKKKGKKKGKKKKKK